MTNPGKPGSPSLNSGKRGLPLKGNFPEETTTPPRLAPLPAIHLVAEWTTMSAPYAGEGGSVSRDDGEGGEQQQVGLTCSNGLTRYPPAPIVLCKVEAIMSGLKY